jgi:hypothetical protein
MLDIAVDSGDAFGQACFKGLILGFGGNLAARVQKLTGLPEIEQDTR